MRKQIVALLVGLSFGTLQAVQAEMQSNSMEKNQSHMMMKEGKASQHDEQTMQNMHENKKHHMNGKKHHHHAKHHRMHGKKHHHKHKHHRMHGKKHHPKHKHHHNRHHGRHHHANSAMGENRNADMPNMRAHLSTAMEAENAEARMDEVAPEHGN